MAKTVQETAIDMSGDGTSPTMFFYLRPVSGAEQTIAQRLYVRVKLQASRDDGHVNTVYTLDEHVGDSDIDTFDSGDAADLRALLNKTLNYAIAQFSL